MRRLWQDVYVRQAIYSGWDIVPPQRVHGSYIHIPCPPNGARRRGFSRYVGCCVGRFGENGRRQSVDVLCHSQGPICEFRHIILHICFSCVIPPSVLHTLLNTVGWRGKYRTITTRSPDVFKWKGAMHVSECSRCCRTLPRDCSYIAAIPSIVFILQ